MKKVLPFLILIAVLVLMFNSCQTTFYTSTSNMHTNVELTKSNFKTLGSFYGTATEWKNRVSIKNDVGLIAQAKKNLLENAARKEITLTGSRTLCNVTIDRTENKNRVLVTISADIIEFTKSEEELVTEAGQEKASNYQINHTDIENQLELDGYTLTTSVSADLKQGEFASQTKKFTKGFMYRIISFSEDNNVLGIGVHLERTDGTIDVKDDGRGRIAIVDYVPKVDREMQVVVKNYSSRTPYEKSRCRIIIAYKQ